MKSPTELTTDALITEQDLEALRTKLNAYEECVRGDDEVTSGLIAHMIRRIDTDMTQLWFYGKALRARRESHSFRLRAKDGHIVTPSGKKFRIEEANNI